MNTDMEAAEIFRTNVRHVMESKAISITELARRVGTSRPGMSRILSGGDAVTIARAERIAKGLGEPLPSLLEDHALQHA